MLQIKYNNKIHNESVLKHANQTMCVPMSVIDVLIISFQLLIKEHIILIVIPLLLCTSLDQFSLFKLNLNQRHNKSGELCISWT